MPALTRWYVKTALVYLALALGLGLLLAGRLWLGPLPILAGVGPVYFHLLMVGWISQLIFGVVYWLFPRFSDAAWRGNERLGWATYGLLNGGLLLRALAEPLNARQPTAVWGSLLVLSALLQWLAGLAFIANTWPRVRGRNVRPRNGRPPKQHAAP